MNDFSRLEDTLHMLQWLDKEPWLELIASFDRILRQQAADSVLTALCVTSAPQWLTGARPCDDDPEENHVVVRAGVAFEFALSVKSGGGVHELNGVFTWVAVNLDDPANRQDRLWMDLGGDLTQFGSDSGEMITRMYFESGTAD